MMNSTPKKKPIDSGVRPFCIVYWPRAEMATNNIAVQTAAKPAALPVSCLAMLDADTHAIINAIPTKTCAYRGGRVG